MSDDIYKKDISIKKVCDVDSCSTIALKGRLVEIMADIDLSDCEINSIDDIEEYRLRLIECLGLSVPSQFVEPLDYIDVDDNIIIEAGGPRGDLLIEDCWMRDQIVITMSDAKDLVSIINNNTKYYAKVDSGRSAIVVINKVENC